MALEILAHNHHHRCLRDRLSSVVSRDLQGPHSLEESSATSIVNREPSTSDTPPHGSFSNKIVKPVNLSTTEASFRLPDYSTGICVRSICVKLHLHHYHYTHRRVRRNIRYFGGFGRLDLPNPRYEYTCHLLNLLHVLLLKYNRTWNNLKCFRLRLLPRFPP